MKERKDARIYALCATSNGVDLLSAVSRRVGLSAIAGPGDEFNSTDISGFFPVGRFASKIGVPFIPLESYSLKSASDREMLLGEDIDILIVCGWQRLIPDWLIGHCKSGAIGIHGGPLGITGSRGRSPQNWALILGASEFELSVFLIDPGVDSGSVLATAKFEFAPGDDINDSYIKVSLTAAAMVADLIEQGRVFPGAGTPQSETPYYSPQRLAGDGEIDWYRKSGEVCRFIAGLTHPYPGAFSRLGRGRLNIWKAKPFLGLELSLLPEFNPIIPGQILFRSESNRIIVGSGDGLVCVEEWDLADLDSDEVEPGVVLMSADFGSQLRSIAARHLQRYPDMQLSPFITRNF